MKERKGVEEQKRERTCRRRGRRSGMWKRGRRGRGDMRMWGGNGKRWGKIRKGGSEGKSERGVKGSIC